MADEAKGEIPNAAFFSQLHTQLSKAELTAGVRLTSSGVFVHEEMVEKIIGCYQSWLQQTSGSSEPRSREKCEKKLFGDDPRVLYYVLDGKRCLPGYLLKGGVGNRSASPIPFYAANLLDTVNYLHPRDPFLERLEGISARLTPHEGFVLDLRLRRGTVHVPVTALEHFGALVRGSSYLAPDYPYAALSLRHCLDPLRSFLDQARPVSDTQQLIIPSRFARERNAALVRHRTVVFVLHEQTLRGCYEVKGKGMRRLLREEALVLGAPGGAPRVQGFEPSPTRPHYAGKIWQKGISFHLHTQALLHFIRASGSKGVKKKLPSRYTTREVIERVTGLFKSAKLVEERTIADALGTLRQPLARYRRVGPWVFVLEDKNVIKAVAFVPEERGSRPGRQGPQRQAQERRGSTPPTPAGGSGAVEEGTREPGSREQGSREPGTRPRRRRRSRRRK